MQRINDFALYELAASLKKVALHKDDVCKSEIWFDANSAARSLNDLLQGIPITIEFSKEATRQLRDYMIKHFVNDKDGKEYEAIFVRKEDEETVHSYKFAGYRKHLLDFETVFATEMRDAATYFVPRRGIYHTPSLIDHADDGFPDDIKAHIPAKSRRDWKAAGRCLAFNLHSASGFHVTRAVEGTLEKYYQTFCNKSPDATLNGWSDYIEALLKVTSNGEPSQKTLSELTQMKDDFRNPLAHPRVFLSEVDARMLFDNGESLILSMAQEIADAEKLE